MDVCIHIQAIHACRHSFSLTMFPVGRGMYTVLLPTQVCCEEPLMLRLADWSSAPAEVNRVTQAAMAVFAATQTSSTMTASNEGQSLPSLSPWLEQMYLQCSTSRWSIVASRFY